MKLKDEGVLKSWGANKKQQKRRKRRIRYTSLGFVLLWYPDSMGITIWDFSSSSAVSSLFLHWWYRWYRIISYVKLRFLFSVSSTKISFFNWVAFDENQKEKKRDTQVFTFQNLGFSIETEMEEFLGKLD